MRQGKPYHATTLQHHARCPMSAHLSQGITSEAMERGRVLHEGIFLMLTNEPGSMDERAALLPPETAKETMDIWQAIEARPPEVMPDAWLERQIIVERDWTTNATVSGSTFTTRDIKEPWITGTPDAIWHTHEEHRTLNILDYKSDAQPGGRGDPALDDQLLCYAALGLSVYPDTRVFRVGHYYMRWGYTAWAEVDDLAVRAARKRLEVLALDLEKCDRLKRWPARVHDKCTWCDFRGACPPYQLALERGFGKGMPRSDAGAVKIKQVAKLMEAEAKRLKELASRYVAKHGPITEGDQVLGHHKREYTSYPFRQTLDLLVQEKDLDPFEVLAEIHSKGFKKAQLKPWTAGGRKNPLNEALEGIADTRIGSTFGWKKIKEGE